MISDGWMDLERLIYQQQWNVIVGRDESGNPTTATEYRSEFILGQDLEGNPQNSDAAIEDVLNWAIARGAQLQIGQILVGGGGAAPVPYKEMHDLPCSAAIQELMRLTPDAVSWFDYTTTPPTFHITRRAACTAVALEFSGEPESVDLTPRNDLVRSEVLIRYVAENTTDGLASTTTTLDAAPGGADGLAFDALVATVRLQGAATTYQKQPIKATPIPAANSENEGGGPADDPTIQFWQRKTGWLQGVSGNQLVITNVYGVYDIGEGDDNGTGQVQVDLSQYPNEIVQGSIADWMNLNVAVCTFTALVSYSFPEDQDSYSDQDWQAFQQFGPPQGDGDLSPPFVVSCKLTASNAVTKTYQSISGEEEGEPVPEGLAAVLYGALSTLHYEGSYRFVQQEVGVASRLGIVLNITGSLEPWSAMNALVQEYEDDLDNGRSTIKVGPPAHLTVQDLMEQLRYTRTRAPSGHASERTTGTPEDGGGDIQGPVNGTIHGGSAPPSRYGFLACAREQSIESGSQPYSFEVVTGYGQISAIDDGDVSHGSPIEKYELSVGNDGSDWAGPGDGHGGSTLDNGLSIISGDDAADNDCLIISRGSGVISLLPNAMEIMVEDEETGNNVQLLASSSGDGVAMKMYSASMGTVNLGAFSGKLVIASSDDSQRATMSCYDVAVGPQVLLENDNTGGVMSIDTDIGLDYVDAEGNVMQIQEATLYLTDIDSGGQVIMAAANAGGTAQFTGPYELKDGGGVTHSVIVLGTQLS